MKHIARLVDIGTRLMVHHTTLWRVGMIAILTVIMLLFAGHSILASLVMAIIIQIGFEVGIVFDWMAKQRRNNAEENDVDLGPIIEHIKAFLRHVWRFIVG